MTCAHEPGERDHGSLDGGAGSAPAAADSCDRPCLIDTMQSYLDALVAHDSSELQVASSLKYTDNGVVAKLGEGLWQTALRVDDDKRLDFADPQAGQVASQLVLDEIAGQAIYQVRLKIVSRAISEIESVTVRRFDAANGFFNVDSMRPEAVFLQPWTRPWWWERRSRSSAERSR